MSVLEFLATFYLGLIVGLVVAAFGEAAKRGDSCLWEGSESDERNEAGALTAPPPSKAGVKRAVLRLHRSTDPAA